MSVAVASGVPTLENARAAATACGEAYENVEDVWVFGSVARGDAVTYSDIDLLVLVTEKGEKQQGVSLADRLALIGKTASGVRCDVVVRTAYQWEHLTTNVSASFEASIEPETVRLFHREIPKHRKQRGGLDGVPANNAEVAARLAEHSAHRLFSMVLTVTAYFKDELGLEICEAFDPDDPQERPLHYARVILASSHKLLEMSIKSIGAAVNSASLGKTQVVDVLIGKLRGNCGESHEVVETVNNLLEPLRTPEGRIRNWHSVAYYGAEPDWIEESTIDNAFDHFSAAIEVTRTAINELDKLAPMSEQTVEAFQRLTRQMDVMDGIAPVKAELERRRHSRR